MPHYAHTPAAGSETGNWHLLEDHLNSTAKLCSEFCGSFSLASTGFLAGLWHDAGKFSAEFQRYLSDCHTYALATNMGASTPQQKPRSPLAHAPVGALAWRDFMPLAAVIAGHHRGLYDNSQLAGLVKACWPAEPAFDAALETARQRLGDPTAPLELQQEWQRPGLDANGCELLTRLLFSALVDADRLDTGKHGAPEKEASRGQYPNLAELLPAYQLFMENIACAAAANDGGEPGRVNLLRAQILQHCLDRALSAPGVYRLTVPTGGGKTLASLGFALLHAKSHGLRRILMAIPYTSIIDQTAQVYRDVFAPLGRPVVVEHHSAVGESRPLGPGSHNDDWRHEEHQITEEERRRELACENWDAPLIVTTTVQLFDSLLSNSTRSCRKLHNLAGSVIILDEAQTLPADMLVVYVRLLEGLVRWAGCTVVLCTATQPGLTAAQGEENKRFHFAQDVLRGEIVPDPTRYFDGLRRVHYSIQIDPGHERWSWKKVANAMLEQRQSLCILNTKKDALAVLDALAAALEDAGTTLADEGVFHLSTLLCGAHRKQVLEKVRSRLIEGLPVRLVSTQVVEAGVDIDFPLVLRALGPLDRIVQAGGRCNREGRLMGPDGKPRRGLVIVFEPAEGSMPQGEYRTASNSTRSFLATGRDDLDLPEAHSAYFRQLYGRVSTDRHIDGKGITTLQQLRLKFSYEEVAQHSSLIREMPAEAVIVPYGANGGLLNALKTKLRDKAPLTREDFRSLQQYSVNVNSRSLAALGHLVLRQDPLNFWTGDYHELRGLVTARWDPDVYMV